MKKEIKEVTDKKRETIIENDDTAEFIETFTGLAKSKFREAVVINEMFFHEVEDTAVLWSLFSVGNTDKYLNYGPVDMTTLKDNSNERITNLIETFNRTLIDIFIEMLQKEN